MPAKSSFIKPCLLFIFLCAFIKKDAELNTIADKLNQWHQRYPQEKVYLHLNKSLFVSGDTLYCKAYVVDADRNLPSSISNILYVDVIDHNDKIITTLLLPVQDGIAWGTMPVGSSLHSGEYHLRAYTNWMRNFDDAFFFDKTITVLNMQDKKSVPAAFSSKISHRIDFFPEGGQLIAGLSSRLAFKAVNEEGQGIAVSGKIMDENSTQITAFKSGFGGMGTCVFTPNSQHNYIASVKYENGFEEEVALPKAEENGYVLHVDNTSNDKINISISAKGMTDEVLLIGQSHNQVQYSAKLQLVNNTISTTIPKKKFPTGIAQFTLFTKDGLPIAERLIFVNHNDQLTIQTSLQKTVYDKREKVQLKIHVTDELDEPLTGSFSIAVTDNNTVPVAVNKDATITSNLLLTSDLKGYIENPGYYFTNVDSNKIKDLDNLLLTQGWRRFLWKEILAEKYPSILYGEEKGLSVKGNVTENGKPQTGSTVLLVSKKGNGPVIETQTDSAGHFSFDSLFFTDSTYIVLQAVSKENKKNLRISADQFSPPASHYKNLIQTSTPEDINKSAYALANEKEWNDRKKYGLISDSGNKLKEVTVTTNQLSKIQQAVAPSANLNGPGNADQVLTYDDLPNCHDLFICLPGKIVGVSIKKIKLPDGSIVVQAFSASGMGRAMLIIVDGMDIPATQASLSNIPANDIQSIEVLRSGAYLSTYGTRAAGGALIITTKKGNLDYNHLDKKDTKTDPNVLFTGVLGYSAYREFYSPQYPDKSQSSSLPDLRSTIYWKPDIVTDDEGNATIEWNNADVTGRYNITIEGISNNGRVGNIFTSYDVK